MVNKFLIIEARFYDDILDSLVEGAIEKLEINGFEYDRLQVPGALEIPAAIAMAADMSFFLGFVALFLLGLFFSFSSTSSLAGERLNKDYYFFFSKHLIIFEYALLGVENIIAMSECSSTSSFGESIN